jgi:DNA recombination protein RmuC
VAALVLGLLIGLVLGAIMGLALAWPRVERLRTELALRGDIHQQIGQVIQETHRVALEQAHASLMSQAAAHLQQAREVIKQTTETVVEPIKERLESLGALQAQLEELKSGTSALSRVLLHPGLRGRWGEVQLKRLVELAGLKRHVDFDEQIHLGNRWDAAGARPDLVINMPGGRKIAVDAKFPAETGLDDAEPATAQEREKKSKELAANLRRAVSELVKRRYQDKDPSLLDVVICYVPVESFFVSALEADPQILDWALENGVLMASPLTLFGLLKTVALGWREEELTKSAKEMQEAAHSLLGRLKTFTGHLAETSRALSRAVEAFNKAAGSYERYLIPSARRLASLRVDATDEASGESLQIGASPQAISLEGEQGADGPSPGEDPHG